MILKKPALIVASIPFYDAPSEIEGSPYWVDLWASVNGYRLGLQIKPKTYNASSVSIYTGKSRSSQYRGHDLFFQRFGGKVIVASANNGELEWKARQQVEREIERLQGLPSGPLPDID